MTIETVIAHFGPPALFLGAALEGETVAAIGGMIAHRGMMPWWMAWGAVFAGTLAADQAYYFAGRTMRDSGPIARLRATPAYERARGMFDRYPAGFVLLFRFLYGLRTVSPILIGTSGFPPVRFLILNILAALVWSVVFVGLGWAFGTAVEQVLGRLKEPLHWLSYLLVPVAVTIGWRAISANRRAGTASSGRTVSDG